jgi:hypothetical protein
MIRALLRVVRRVDRYEWVGITCGVILIAGMTGVLGPTLEAAADAQARAQHHAVR